MNRSITSQVSFVTYPSGVGALGEEEEEEQEEEEEKEGKVCERVALE